MGRKRNRITPQRGLPLPKLFLRRISSLQAPNHRHEHLHLRLRLIAPSQGDQPSPQAAEHTSLCQKPVDQKPRSCSLPTTMRPGAFSFSFARPHSLGSGGATKWAGNRVHERVSLLWILDAGFWRNIPCGRQAGCGPWRI